VASSTLGDDMLDIYIDADGCPVKDEVYRVAERYGLKTYVVANKRMRVPFTELVELKVVSDRFDAADDWIYENVKPGDIVITADLPLTDRCLNAGAFTLNHKGVEHTAETIGSALATRELLDQLRQMGEMTGGPPPMNKRDKSTFLSALDQLIQDIKNA